MSRWPLYLCASIIIVAAAWSWSRPNTKPSPLNRSAFPTARDRAASRPFPRFSCNGTTLPETLSKVRAASCGDQGLTLNRAM